ncbi:TRAP transporter small permease subunit [Rhodobacterales bacterium HKCCE2091]|nr:TRAP transporter small permease subunit [Rhodobacterales bacterium HKCCE2091]
MHLIGTILGRLVGLAAVIGTLAIAALVCLTVVTVTFRFLGIAFPGTYVLAELLIIPAVTFALAYTAWSGAHTRVELLTDRLPRRVRDPLLGVMLALGAGFWGMVANSAIEEVLRRSAQGESTPILDIPVAPFRWMMIAAIVLLIAVLLYRALETALGRGEAAE